MTVAYTTGTIALINGQKSVIGTGTGWSAAGIVSGVIFVQGVGNPLPFSSITDDTHLTADINWTGPTGSYAYAMVVDTSDGRQTVTNMQALATYIQRLNNTSLAAVASLSGTMVADRILYTMSDTTAAWTPLTAFARSLLDDANAATARATLGAFSSAGGTIAGNVGINGDTAANQMMTFYKAGVARVNMGIMDNSQANFFLDVLAGGTWIGRPLVVENATRRVLVNVGLNIETTENVARLLVRGHGQSQGYGAVFRAGNDTGTAGAVLFQNSSAGWVGEITQSVTSVVYGTASDHRLKYDVQPLVTDFELTADGFDVLDEAHLRVMAMRPVSYYWIAHPETGRQTGFLAHELQLTSPYAVTGDKDGVEAIGTAMVAGYIIPAHTLPGEPTKVIDPETGEEVELQTPDTLVPDQVIEPQIFAAVRDGEIHGADWVQTGTRPVYQAVDHSKIVPDLVAAVQRLTVITLDQVNQIAALSTRLEALETSTSPTE